MSTLNESVPRIDFTEPGRLEVLLRTRLLVQANSGGGKSRALRSLLEQTHGQVQQIVLDPEGEFATLRERFPFVLAGKEADVAVHPKTARTLCRRLFEEQASAVIDLFDLSLSDRREFVKLFLTELMALPRTLWRPALIVLDEAHLFAPERGSGEAQSTDAVISLCTQGRKRGFCAVLATQRISKLHKDAAAELLNKLIGRTGLDVDMKRAGDELGMDKERRLALRDLLPGEFMAFGPMFGGGVHAMRSADVLTTHPDANRAGAVAIPKPNANVQAVIARLGDIPAIAEKAEADLAALQQQVRTLQVELRHARAGKGVPDPAETERAVAAAVRDADLRATHREREVRAVVETIGADLRAAADRLEALVTADAPEKPFASSAPVVAPAPRQPRATATVTAASPAFPIETTVDTTVAISRTMRRMLSVMVSLEALGVEWPEWRTIAGWSGLSHTTGTFSNQKRALRDSGCVVIDGTRAAITDYGRSQADPAPAITSLDELHTVWASKFSATVARMFRALVEMSGPQLRPVSKAALAAAVGVSHTTGTFSNQLREMRTPGVTEDVDKQHIRLTNLVFPEGLS